MSQSLTLVLLCAATASAFEVADPLQEELDPRFLFFNSTGALIPIDATALLAGIGFLVILTLLGIGIWLLVSSLAPKLAVGGGGYGGYHSGGYGAGHSGGSSYSGYQARSADPYSAIWDKMSVLDWIAMMEEVYRKFDATSLECQQRLVCELHQNENSWGTTARKMNDAFSYLQYMELLNLPSELRMLLDEYLDAANKGRTSEKSCADHFAGCEFSMKTLISKYNGSNAL
ncbi:uncharacterized protein LOC119102165 isoform X2 [Pollicipes pollicipes]|uniref:uncharacterized protein LOC119102163 isoform X1 n=1 Tax=Pollicipes pollicipes TaxID=41117 RepID=UPI001885A33A|nr:uncharacterized protein LOC119102163 isoform X1 [Pollicipes pollicipes]XP_037081410.1 uncharacterized protein LOC119102165 isoform X2 [Pollicipes pollicipes]